MKWHFSPSTSQAFDGTGYHLLKTLDDELQGTLVPLDERRVLVAVDWKEYNGASAAVLRQMQEDHQLARCALNIQQSLLVRDADLLHEMLHEVELYLSLAGPRARRLMSELCVAPLRKPGDVAKVLHACDGKFTITFGLCKAWQDLQPRLRATVDATISVCCAYSEPVQVSSVWKCLRRASALADLCDASDMAEFNLAWMAGAPFVANMPSQNYLEIGGLIAAARFGRRAAVAFKSEDHSLQEANTSGVRPFAGVESIKRQIDSIVAAYAKGNDRQAEKRLDALQAEQSGRGDAEHLVRSLCNIAQRMSGNFRPEVEGSVLRRALQVSRDDEWLLIQFADYHKRRREWVYGLEKLGWIANAERQRVATNLKAELLFGLGSCEEAIALVNSLVAQAPDDVSLTLLGDMSRKLGHFEDALLHYARAREVSTFAFRAMFGEALVWRAIGSLDEARTRLGELYEIAGSAVDQAHVALCLSTLEARLGNMGAAASLLDDVVSSFPFWTQPRALKRSLALAFLDGESSGNQKSRGRDSGDGEWIMLVVEGLRHTTGMKGVNPVVLVRKLRELAMNEQAGSRIHLIAALVHNRVTRIADFASVDRLEVSSELNAALKAEDSLTRLLAHAVLYHRAAEDGEASRRAQLGAELERQAQKDPLAARLVASLADTSARDAAIVNIINHMALNVYSVDCVDTRVEIA